jgi:teichuronic acid exporter
MTILPPEAGAVKQRTLDGMYWNAVEIAVRFGFQFGVTVILARLLTPEEFGIVALAFVFIGITGVLIESGFSTAIVQQRDVDDLELSAIFHLQWLLALVLGIGLGLASPWIASFCGYPVLEPLIWTMALTLLLYALGGVHSSLLSRALNFRPVVIAGLTSTILGGALAVFVAFQGFGVWALASQAVATAVFYVSALWLSHPWRPQMVFRWKLLKRSFAFGGFVFLVGLSDAIYGRLYWLAIGKIYGAADLAQYNRAEATAGVPSGMLTGFITRVGFPAFSAVQDDGARLKAGVRKAVIGVMAINVPVMFGMLAVAEPLVLTFFGEVWRPSVPILQIVCLAGLVWPLHVINFRVLLALGHSRRCFQIEIAKKGVGIVCTLAALPFSLEALAWGQFVYGIICYAIHAHYTKRLVGYGGLAQVWDCLPWFLAGALMMCSVWLLQFVLSMAAPITLTVQVVFGTVLYLIFWLVWDVRLFREMTRIVIPGRKIVKA